MMVFITMLIAVFVILMLNVVRYQNLQILGVTLAPKHAETAEVKAIQRSYQKEQLFIAGAFVLLTWLTSLDFFRGWRDFVQLLLLFVYFIVSYVPFALVQKRLGALKETNNWVYEKQKRVADLSVSREKGKAAPDAKWVWLSWLLGWVPFLVAWFMGEGASLLVMLVVVPLVMLVIPLSYPLVIKPRTSFVSKDSEVTKVYMRRYERINAVSYLRTAYLVNGFLIALSLVMLAGLSHLWLLGVVVVFLVALVWNITNTMRANQALQEELFDKAPWQISESSGQYKWGTYHDPNDTRLFVPKRSTGMGSTINLAHPFGKVLMGGILVLVVGVIGFSLMMATADYDVVVEAESVMIDVPFYGVEIPVEQIAGIELSQEPLEATRVNGFGGQEKRFGDFNLDGYGSVRLFEYRDQPYHILVEMTADSDWDWVVLNAPTEEETFEIYESLVSE